MFNFNITIGYTEQEPNSEFVELVQRIVSADNSAIGNIKIAHLTEKNIDAFIAEATSTRDNQHIEAPRKPKAQDQKKNKARSLSGYSKALDQPDLIVFDVSQLGKKPSLIKPLFKTLDQSDCAVLLLNPKHPQLTHIILKYDGTEPTVLSILYFNSLFPSKSKNAESSVLISPLAFKKSRVALEKKFVAELATRYGALGFIKLPFNTVNDFMNYSLKTHGDLLVLSQPDLEEISTILSANNFKKKFKGQAPSIFININSSTCPSDHNQPVS